MYCDFCRFATIDMRMVQSNKDKRGYILSCKKCESEKGLEDVPTYAASELIEFYEQRKMDPIVPMIIKTDDGSKYIQFHDGSSQFLSREELELIAVEINKTLSLDHSLDKYIEKYNKQKRLEQFYSYSEKDRSKFQIPYEELRLSKKHFNPDKRKWSFKCGNCSDLININVQFFYYTVVPEFDSSGNDRGCSKDCTKVIIKDIIQNWLHNSGADKYFYTDDLSEEIIDVINKA